MEETNNNVREKINIHERIAKLETNVNSILENHLPHLQQTVDGLNMKFWAVIVLLITNLTGVVAYFMTR